MASLRGSPDTPTPIRSADMGSAPRPGTESHEMASLLGLPVHPDASLLDLLGGPVQVAAAGLVLLAHFINPSSTARPQTKVLFGVLANVHCLLGLDQSQESIKKSLQSMGTFLLRMRYLDQTSISSGQLQLLYRRFDENPAMFHPEVIGPLNKAGAVLCTWTNAVCARAGVILGGSCRGGAIVGAPRSSYSSGAPLPGAPFRNFPTERAQFLFNGGTPLNNAMFGRDVM